jgi:hypothetical protein
MAPSPPGALHTRRQRRYDHDVFSCVVPSDVDITRHATAAQLLGQGVCEPPGDFSNSSNLLISADHADFPISEHGSLLLHRGGCLRLPRET